MRIFEDLLHGKLKEGGEAVGEVEGGDMLLGFQCVDGLAGNADAVGEVFLRPVAFSTQDFEPVFHEVEWREWVGCRVQWEVRMKGVTAAKASQKSGQIIQPGICGTRAYISM